MSLQYMGVNLSGLEFGTGVGTINTNYVLPGENNYSYWSQEVGSNIVRLPFTWERLQPQLGGALDQNYLSYLKQSVSYAEAHGMSIILDLHNYGLYNGQLATAAQLSDVWTKLGQTFKGDSSVWFDIMNEPNNVSATQWENITQQAVNAIRAAGIDNKILLEGTAWSGAHSWISSGNAAAFSNFKDPANNYAFDVHQYLDSDSSGTSATAVPGSGSTRLVDVTKWAESTGQKLFLGETGLANNAGSETEMKAMINYMNQHSGAWLGMTLWGAGPWWGSNYIYNINPTGLGTSSVANAQDINDLLSYLAPGTSSGGTTPTPPVTGAPVANADDFYGQQYHSVSGNVLLNNGHGADSDPGGLALTVAAAQLTTARGGAVVLNSDGTFTYNPASSFFGADSFTYTLKDSAGLSATGTVNVNVNAAPVAHPDDFKGSANVAISGNVLADNGHGADSDPIAGTILTAGAASLTTAHGGHVTLTSNGSFIYTPASGYSGSDSFHYSLLDGRGGQADGTVSITLSPTTTSTTPSSYTFYGTEGADKLYANSTHDSTIYGLGGNDDLYGGNCNDTIYSGAGNDLLHGGGGNDILNGGAGSDKLSAGSGNDLLIGSTGIGKTTMTGNAGADIFHVSDIKNYTKVADYSVSQGDKLDISQLLQGVDPLQVSINNYIHATSTASGIAISVDVDGAANGSHFVAVVTLQNVFSYDVSTALQNGSLIA